MTQTSTQKNLSQLHAYDIMVTGSTGFIGSRLLKKLVALGYTVTALSRKKIPDEKNIRYVQADVLNSDELAKSLEGIRVAYYLLHSMEGDKRYWKEFADRERRQAQNFLKAATAAGVERIIYLGGLVNDSLELSKHMQSRKEVGDILASGDIPVTQLRASLIIGAGGGSYAMLRYLVERLRVMITPRWVKSQAQPIAVDDVIEYLAQSLEKQETVGRTFDIGGPEKLSYEEMMRQYAAYLNKNIFVMNIPFLTPRLSSYWVDLITPVPASLARPLIDSLRHDSTVKDDSITKIIPLRLRPVREAIDIATKEIRANPPEGGPEGRTRFQTNHKLLIGCLFALAVIGTTYYYLDDRKEVYRWTWLAASTIWYGAIGFAILFVFNKTRLGYLIAGILSWVTLAFWMFDNYYVAFHTAVIATRPDFVMTVRNFVGVGVAALSVASSHNVFHKIRMVQHQGRPV
ncbi:NAD-dependent epimerase/dehydratase [Nitrosotalea sinensis]|uniref:NAD-dependent epimerase/dehydratase n=1 Tax=Nitrosotalea sinensis TaxID=1499975 RepID=A0A2H1EGV6_9ARCH|nr:NAD(P)H-binding protein [Candidatus Nitrosotalea sinensis]SHO45794.1 NAD-dependent epimerase/dehydratase [Candidatus Nitrosotalea sinensis]